MGRKPKYNEPTKTKAFRVPISKEKELERIVKDLQRKWSAETIKQDECDCYIENGLLKRGKSGCKKTKQEHKF